MTPIVGYPLIVSTSIITVRRRTATKLTEMADGFLPVPLRSVFGMNHREVVVNNVQELLLGHRAISLDICTQAGGVLCPDVRVSTSALRFWRGEESRHTKRNLQ